MIVDVQVVPRASRVAVGPAVGDRLRVAVTALRIVRGETGRRKTVEIDGGRPATLQALLRGE